MTLSDGKLDIQGVCKSFKGVHAVKDVSFAVSPGEIVGLIGPNGAGKTSLFNLIAGIYKPDAGQIIYQGRVISGLRSDEVSRQGVGRTFQIVKPFKGLTVEDNVMIGALTHGASVARARSQARDILALLHLDGKRMQLAKHLTLPECKCLEVARALSTQPTLLLLDEVMAGLRPNETDEMLRIFEAVNKQVGLSILMIEHVMRAVMALSHHIIVLNYGEKIAEGAPAEIAKNPKVLECYLGQGAA